MKTPKGQGNFDGFMVARNRQNADADDCAIDLG
jgi:hypothetical protein